MADESDGELSQIYIDTSGVPFEPRNKELPALPPFDLLSAQRAILAALDNDDSDIEGGNAQCRVYALNSGVTGRR